MRDCKQAAVWVKFKNAQNVPLWPATSGRSLHHCPHVPRLVFPLLWALKKLENKNEIPWVHRTIMSMKSTGMRLICILQVGHINPTDAAIITNSSAVHKPNMAYSTQQTACADQRFASHHVSMFFSHLFNIDRLKRPTVSWFTKMIHYVWFNKGWNQYGQNRPLIVCV